MLTLSLSHFSLQSGAQPNIGYIILWAARLISQFANWIHWLTLALSIGVFPKSSLLYFEQIYCSIGPDWDRIVFPISKNGRVIVGIFSEREFLVSSSLKSIFSNDIGALTKYIVCNISWTGELNL